MSVENIHEQLEEAHEFTTQGIADLHAADQIRTDISDVLQTYGAVVQALPSGQALADKHGRVSDGSVTAAEHFDQAHSMVERLGSENVGLIGASSALGEATDKLDTLSAADVGLREIDQLRDALVKKVTEVLGVLSSESLGSNESPVAIAEGRSRSAALAIGTYIDTVIGR